MEGYFKVHRKILDSQVFAHQTALKIWIWCLAKVTFKERFVSVKINKGEKIVKLKPGQFIFGRFKAEEELNIDGSTIYKWMQKFSSSEFDMIKIESNNQYSIITLCKWEEYQNEDANEVTTIEQPCDNGVTTIEQPCDTNNNDNNVKNEKNFIKPTIDEIRSYCIERGNNIDAEYFFNKQESIGWMIGKNKMKDWKAAIRTWEKFSKKQISKPVMPC